MPQDTSLAQTMLYNAGQSYIMIVWKPSIQGVPIHFRLEWQSLPASTDSIVTPASASAPITADTAASIVIKQKQ